MSLRNRFVDGVNSLFEKLGNEETLGAVDPVELERELAKRVAARGAAGDLSPSLNKKARVVRAGDASLKERIAMAAKRVAKIHKARKAKAATQKREQDAAFRNMADEARRAPPRHSSRSSSRSRSSSSSSSRSRRPSIFQNKDLASAYKTLNVEYGADAKTVKKAYRALMRKYHPDLHQDPKKKKAATSLTVKISSANDTIEKSRK